MRRPLVACAVLVSSVLLVSAGMPGLTSAQTTPTPLPPVRPADLSAPPATYPTQQVPESPPNYEAAIASDTELVRPWRAWTPGAVRSATKDEICGAGTTEVRKSLRSSTKRAVGRRYRVAKGGAFVYDHLVPLAVGGDPDNTDNLWPQPRRQAHVKDKCENRARAMLCSRGTLGLAEAQRGFMSDYVAFCASIGVPQK